MNSSRLRYSYSHRYPQSYLDRLSSMDAIRMPQFLKVLSWIICVAMALLVAALVWVPWVQTAPGAGRVSTLDPRDRVQQISAMVSGRVAQWYVNDATTVKAGDPIVRIMDVDGELVFRLEAQMEAARRKFEAARDAKQTSLLDLERRQKLFEEGLTSRLDVEQASIRVQQLRISEEQSLAELNEAEVKLSRQGSQIVYAPRDGTILHVEAGDEATMVSAGQALASFLPAGGERVVEMSISGRDVGLVYPGRAVRLQFDGWPAFQFSGLPEFAVGTFAGEVMYVDPSAGADGRFRVVVREQVMEQACLDSQVARPGMHVAGNCGWPPESFVRLGAAVQGWVLLDTVPLGYELWRRMNNFPPRNNMQSAADK